MNNATTPEIDMIQLEENPLKQTDNRNELIRMDQNNTTFATEGNDELKLETEYFYKHCLVALAIHLIHAILGPISIPLLWLLFGRKLCTNMGFSWHRFYRNEFYPWVWAMLTLIFFVRYLPQFNTFMSLILATNAIILIKTLLVSVKYGFYTEQFWKMIKTQYVDIKILANQLILIGWLRIPSEVILQELLNSFGRLNRSPDELCIVFKSSLPREFKDMIERSKDGYLLEIHHERSIYSHKDKECIPTILLAKMIIEYSTLKSISKCQILIIDIVAIIYTASPIISVVVQYGVKAFYFGPYEIVYMAYSLLLCFVVSKTFLRYVLVGIVDMRRKMFLMEQCSALITKRESHNSFLKEYRLPGLDFTDMRTIDSWYIMRSAFLDFGRRYTYRIFVYASLVLPICTFLIIALIIQFFSTVQFISIPAMIAVIFLTFACLVLILYMIIIGADINEMFDKHRDLIVNLNNDSLHLRKTEDQNHNVYQALSLINHKLEQDEKARPVKIMGLKADSKFLSKLVALLFSGIASLLQVVLKGGSTS